jgi:hydroxyacid-oxoacid transhydrogenase
MVPALRIAPSRAARAINLLRTIQSHPPSCPCHSNPSHHHHEPKFGFGQLRKLATPIDHSREKEYAFEMAASSIRFGPGCTKEVGMDVENLGAKKVIVVTDRNVDKLPAMQHVREALDERGINFEVFNDVHVEPKDTSVKAAIDFARPLHPDLFLAVGGKSLHPNIPAMINSSRRLRNRHRQIDEPLHQLSQR